MKDQVNPNVVGLKQLWSFSITVESVRNIVHVECAGMPEPPDMCESCERETLHTDTPESESEFRE